ncbi:centromere protein Q [Misgurnus anguillicaudatus]|uniref:centromere protein Q n=1 Tax=Misgurnus anguillicaudatus TaxID=75329 RepID=UPI002435EE2D|nr:centromere protein Q [Misgurnus anguillicaudatus]XP_055062250.1 centromere protein Q [Misgurnus anguillicaudatus]
MKTSRGSSRASTQNPRGTTQKKTNARSKKCKGSAADPEHLDRNRTVARNEKSHQSWKRLNKSSLLALENMLNVSVLSVLMLKSKDKDESQKHLNLIKNQFLAQCAKLSVPPRKYGDIIQVSHQFKTESRKSEQGKKTLETLEGNLSSIVGTLEEIEEKMDSLEKKCRTMRSQLEEEEENAQEFLQLSKQTVLGLPVLPPCPANELSLQEHMMKMVPDPSAVVRALQTDPVVEDVKAFLTLAHKQVDTVQTDKDTALD